MTTEQEIDVIKHILKNDPKPDDPNWSDATVTGLIAHIDHLQAENERLRKVVECAKAFIREDETESATADWVKARNDLQQALASLNDHEGIAECEKGE